jgi:subfamily B ATP-binding cassette protein MsbA
LSSTPRPEITNLLELEHQREQVRQKLRIWHLFLPASGDDLRAYRGLLRYVKPYRSKLVLSIAFAMLSALFLGVELAVLQGGLGQVLGAKPPIAAVAPEAAPAGGDAAAGESPQAAPTSRAPSWVQGARKWLVERRDAAGRWVCDKFGIPSDPNSLERKRRLLWLLAGALVVAVLIASLAKYGQAVLMTGVSRRIVRDIRADLFKHLMGLSVRFHQKNHSAQLVSRITNDLEVFGRFLTEALVRFIQDSLDFSAMLIYIAFNEGVFIFVIAAVIGVAIAPVNAIARRLRKGDRKSQAGMAEIATVISEALVGQRVVKAFASEEREYRRFRSATRQHMKRQLRVRRLRSMTEPVVMGIGALGIATIVVIGGHRVLAGKLDPTGLVVNVLALARAMMGLRGMSKQLNDFQLGLAAADRVGTMMQARSEISEKPDATPLPPFEREIRFENVHFRHEESRPTLQGVDLVIRKGEKVALVGPSGAGKTTFIDLLPRFYDVDGGRILIDGHDVRDVTLKSLREQIGIVSQETILFRDSIRDNIAYGRPDANDEEILAAARAANAHEFIQRAPKRYDTLVGERGFRLSGGERQRLAIARALLRDPPILILDEATSSLDSVSEAVVQAALQRLMKGRTVIVIAHRLATVRDADRIVVLEKGRIVEMGSHDELMHRPNGLYRRHWKIQNRGRPEPAPPPSAPIGTPRPTASE